MKKTQKRIQKQGQSTLCFWQAEPVEKKKIYEGILRDTLVPLVIYALSGGFLLSLFSWAAFAPALLLEGLALLLWQSLCIRREKGLLGLAPLLFFLVALPLAAGGLWRNGLAIALNGVLDAWKQSYPRLLSDFYVDPGKGGMLSVTLCLSTPAALWSYLSSLLGRKRIPALTGVYLAVLMLLQWLFGTGLALPARLALPILTLMLASLSWLERDEAKGTGGLAVVGMSGLGLGFCALTALAFCLALPGEGYALPGFLEEGREKLYGTVMQLRYGGEASGLPDGDFRGLSAREFSEDPMLEITMSEPESLYLRGFSGSLYTGEGFEDLDQQSDYEQLDLYYWLHQQGFSGLTQLGKAAEAIGEKEESLKVTVENLRASARYLYAPYELTLTETELKQGGDRWLAAEGIFGERAYSFETAASLVPRYKELSAKLAEGERAENTEVLEYLKKEGYYNEAGYQECLEVPEDLTSFFQIIFEGGEIPEGESHKDYNEAKQLITYYLSEQMTYREDISPYGGGEDFVYDFLVNTREGYDVHYAAAATLMFRYFGIPARYVEGYLITKETAENAGADEPFTLDGRSAHAWTEYYHDGLGWLPYEVTPAYLDAMEQAEDYLDISSLMAAYKQDQEDGSAGEEEEEEENEEAEEEAKESFPLWKKLLIAAGIFLLLLMFAVMLWIAVERGRTRRLKQSFEDEDPRIGIRSMFLYTAAVMTAYGVPKKPSPYEREELLRRGVSPECAMAYREVVDLRQEAVYSDHTMTEEQRERVRRFKDRLVREVWENSSLAERFQYRFQYFL